MEIITQLKNTLTNYCETVAQIVHQSENLVSEIFYATKHTFSEILNTLQAIDLQFFT